MKVLLVASSIFYLLGLKISNNIDLVKKTNITPVIENKLEKSNTTTGKDADFFNEKKLTEIKTGPDSLNITGTSKTDTEHNKDI
ncbi:MAG: hypothetical protein JXR31_04995 [Prolixibacteraceae bacterium]|nr:hypothetical protein [Prolixibacteraceae bacterium]MBN2773583.1 hypothetical protein [Prolixibacteraceae bacterium]